MLEYLSEALYDVKIKLVKSNVRKFGTTAGHFADLVFIFILFSRV